MRIVYLHQYFVTPRMAGGSRSYEMARRLVAAGHEVHMITSDHRRGGCGGEFVLMCAAVEDRKREEARFHDQREMDRHRLTPDEFLQKYPNKSFYAIDRQSKQFMFDWLAEKCPGKRALDYCCGNGQVALRLA